jgi:hypothetical protein
MAVIIEGKPKTKTPKGRQEKIEETKKILLAGYAESWGNVSHACDVAGVTRPTFYNYMNRYPEFKQAVLDSDERVLDLVETKLKSKCKEGDLKAITYYLDNKAKHRGFGSNPNIEVNMHGNVQNNNILVAERDKIAKQIALTESISTANESLVDVMKLISLGKKGSLVENA